ncbi:NlpC/P60 family protein [Aliiruegeria sabulilitoris]|uniref:NlpC/P60 family protein n=1 Tax=Aliiruegeria sabulilitoris TaxID=1510458 RepID=UPI0009E6CD13|nr:NlpC/P60 family protein [Aliiruegeria sabulilitoris]NDR56058.1 peptidase [Pseudoruegeria sp. M32A2M]
MQERVVEIARSWIGTPYRHQASVRGAGSDCLGLIRGVWRTLYGQEPELVPSYSPDWSEPSGEERLWRAAARHLEPRAARETIEQGDVLLFRMRHGSVAKHLGIYSLLGGSPSLIHAYQGHSVLESPLTEPLRNRVVARFAFPEGSS